MASTDSNERIFYPFPLFLTPNGLKYRRRNGFRFAALAGLVQLARKYQHQMKPTLLILAAGMGSRYGGLKQIDGVGPSGEAIIEYSIYDAIRAGFGKVVFVIRRDIEDAFKAFIGDKLDGRIEVAYAFQEIEDLPGGFTPPADRTKPWGTTHAVWVARDVIHEPFAMINADDFYGALAYQALAAHFAALTSSRDLAMVGYRLDRTLSDHGFVSRGVCTTDAEGFLISVVERTKIARIGEGILFEDENGAQLPLADDTAVSMNFWGFTPELFPHLESVLTDFLNDRGQEAKSECYIPNTVGGLVDEGKFTAKVLRADSPWFGVTYREDKAIVEAQLRSFVDQGLYPESLWS